MKIISTHIFICILLQIINMVKVTYQGQGENSMSFQFYVAHTVVQAGGLHSTEMRSCWAIFPDPPPLVPKQSGQCGFMENFICAYVV